jgi:hypothetical protein
MTELKRHPQGTGWFDSFRVRPDKADAGGRHACLFDIVAQNADGARAARSDRQEQDGVHPVFLEQTGDFSSWRFELFYLVGAADGVVKICQAADDTFRNHLTESVKGKNDIPVPLETAAVETGRQVGHNQVIGLHVARDNTVEVVRVKLEGVVMA